MFVLQPRAWPVALALAIHAHGLSELQPPPVAVNQPDGLAAHDPVITAAPVRRQDNTNIINAQICGYTGGAPDQPYTCYASSTCKSTSLWFGCVAGEDFPTTPTTCSISAVGNAVGDDYCATIYSGFYKQVYCVSTFQASVVLLAVTTTDGVGPLPPSIGDSGAASSDALNSLALQILSIASLDGSASTSTSAAYSTMNMQSSIASSSAGVVPLPAAPATITQIIVQQPPPESTADMAPASPPAGTQMISSQPSSAIAQPPETSAAPSPVDSRASGVDIIWLSGFPGCFLAILMVVLAMNHGRFGD
ncbi:uncharacterized protein MYCGRDRAFT_94029 [Zymoseptoria tritici IPO323]|uniref:Ca2+-modulated nonselective cation channel polycystin n=1 Tax=Zymoseptoria tritici (strain CBS 115943 / IPO323) TaxID=336722 RepID=F9XDT6_ZYMTI|nr:uncharacterized protein MYCGRDRAFT_94029 [Zymoseptoria tritici IPO323]EGP86745.1 hypothetical protein MYCGRDRAFT_94029 [Zymoseptoria tritici IPO323]